MRVRPSIAVSLLLAAIATGAVANGAVPRRQWAVTYLKAPTLVGSTIVQGPVLFVHDDAKMARGEPCTSVFLFDPNKGPDEEIASFQCIPKTRKVAAYFTIRTKPNSDLGYGCILTEYQFAGDGEGHGVPLSANAH